MQENDDVRKVIIFGKHFWEFYQKQNSKIIERINWTIKLIKTIERVPEKYLKHITGTTLYGMRMVSGTNLSDILFFRQGQSDSSVKWLSKKDP